MLPLMSNFSPNALFLSFLLKVHINIGLSISDVLVQDARLTLAESEVNRKALVVQILLMAHIQSS